MRRVIEAARVSGPVSGTPWILMAGFDLASVGYVLEEFFLEGTATSFEMTGAAGPDGHWDVRPAAEAPFVTRLLLCRPSDPGAFTGTVVVEWLNVSAGIDAPAHWMLTHRQVVRAGWAWVGVSAQRRGIEGDGGIFRLGGEDSGGFGLQALKQSDPARYGGLHHPGDAFCFDIFGQAVRAVRTGAVPGLRQAEYLLASGESQSAIHMVTYLNAVVPTLTPEAASDGYLIGSRGGSAAPLSGWDGQIRPGPEAARVRTDLSAPVLTVLTETDVTGLLGGVVARQPDSNRFRWWEIAGAAHADTYVLGASFSDSGSLDPAELARLTAATATPVGMPCPEPVNSGLQHHYVSQAAIAHLDQWARGGSLPPSAPRLETGPDDPMHLVTDGSGIARGGIRTGWVDAPVAALSGLTPEGADGLGVLLGSTRAFDQAELARRYPRGRGDYSAAFRAATMRAVADGFLLAEDADEIVAVATAAYPAP
jgi:Alpha/beta hydrolase domain